MKLYKSCNTLSIARFFRIIKTNDYRNLIVGFDFENDDLEIKAELFAELDSIFKNIFYEYTDLTNNTKVRGDIRKKILITEWSIIYDVVVESVNFYFETKDIGFLKNLEEVGYPINFEKDILKQLDVIGKKMKGLKNKIKIYKINLSKNYSEDKKEVEFDLNKEAIYLEKNLELKREIDIETTSVSKWIQLMEFSKLKHKENGAN